MSTNSTGGMSTLSTTCIIPLEATTSGLITLASLTITPVESIVNDRLSPFSAGATMPSVRSVDNTEPETTWYVSISANRDISSVDSYADKSKPAAVKASSVGANTVNGPVPSKVVTRSALARAATSDE